MPLAGTLLADECSEIEYGWTITLGGVDSDYAHALEVNADGSIYWAGDFADTVDFDPSDEGTDFRTSLGQQDAFLMKLTADGVPVWTYTFGSWLSEGIYGIAVAEDGSVYASAYFYDQIDFDPGPGVDQHTSNGGADVCVTKLAPDGDYLWTRTFGGIDQDVTAGCAVDAEGNIAISGSFYDRVDFDPSDFGEHIIVAEGDDGYVVTLSPEGDFEAVITFGGTGCDFVTSSPLFDDLGTMYVLGEFELTVDFDPDETEVEERTSLGGSDVFILHLSPAGELQWVHTVGTSGFDYSRGLAIQGDGSVVYTGSFSDLSPIDFDPSDGTDERLSNGTSDAFVSKLGADGSYGWTWTAGAELYDYGLAIATDPSSQLLVAGSFGQDGYAQYEVDFDQAGAGDVQATIASADLFATRLRADGQYSWTYTVGGTNYDYVCDIAVREDTILLTGDFGKNVDFDPTIGLDGRSSTGGGDMFISKWLCASPETCDGDVNVDGTVDPLDAGFVLSRFGCAVGSGDSECDAADANTDGTVDPLDSGYVMSRFGLCE